MENIVKILFLLSFGCVFFGCEDKPEEAAPQLSIMSNHGETLDGASLSFAGEGGASVVVIDANSPWRIGCSAEWIRFSATEGHGSAEVEISVAATDISRSAVVVVYAQIDERIRASFNVVQHAPTTSSPDDTPDDTPTQEPDNAPDDAPDDTPTQEPDNAPDDAPDDTPTQEPDDAPNDTPTQEPDDVPDDAPDDTPAQEPDDVPDNAPDDTPAQEPDDVPDDDPNNTDGGYKPEIPILAYTKIVDVAELRVGVYYIGGYQGDVLYLATAGISTGHLHTTPFTYNDADGTLSSSSGLQAVEVSLVSAGDSDTYYLNFGGEGYLMAMDNTAGALTFTDKPQAAWQFKQADGGLELLQVGDIYVKLIVSRRATDRLLRSIDGDEDDGNPIVLFRKD